MHIDTMLMNTIHIKVQTLPVRCLLCIQCVCLQGGVQREGDGRCRQALSSVWLVLVCDSRGYLGTVTRAAKWLDKWLDNLNGWMITHPGGFAVSGDGQVCLILRADRKGAVAEVPVVGGVPLVELGGRAYVCTPLRYAVYPWIATVTQG